MYPDEKHSWERAMKVILLRLTLIYVTWMSEILMFQQDNHILLLIK